MENKDKILPKGFRVADQFEIQFPIAGRAFCRSYRAKNESGNIVQLDLINLASLPSSYFNSQGTLRLFDLLTYVRHPNIAQCVQQGETIIEKQKFAFAAFRFVSGETLTQRLAREGTLSLYTAVPMVIEILDTLAYLHNQDEPIVHNNINPRTIQLDYASKRDKTILSSFEQARFLKENGKSIAIKYLSPFHTAPEVLNGVFVAQSDLFSIGALLYHLLFGVPPFFNEKTLHAPLAQEKAMLEAARHKTLDFSFTDEDTIHEQLKNTLIKALAIDVQDRFQHAADFAKALKGEMLVKSISEQNKNIKPIEKIVKKQGTGFCQIAGMDALKQQLKEDIIDFLHDPDLYKKYGVPMLNGMLLYGPPGCGKTFIAQKFAEEAGYHFVMLKPSDVQSKFVNATQENISAVFKQAAQKAPTIIFIDELDAIVPTREGELHQMHASAVNEVLAQMTNCGERGIFVIGATNRPEKIDPAILRTGRMDKLVYLAPPDKNARAAMFALYLKNRPIDLALDYENLAAMTNNYVSSDLKFLIDEASRKALKTRALITMDIFEDICKKNKPSVTLAEIKKYERLQQQWNRERNNLPTTDERNTIGFRLTNKK